MSAPAVSQPAATPTHTAALAARQGTAEFYRAGWDGLNVATIGLGTYLGDPDSATDDRYVAAIGRYFELGGNLVDSAINYRFQRSERAIGAALTSAIAAGVVSRNEVVLCTKAGYLSFDGDWPSDPEAWVRTTFLDTGIVRADDIVDGHCMAPAYLRHQIRQSRANLQVECIDLYYLHNPEAELAASGISSFSRAIARGFRHFRSGSGAGPHPRLWGRHLERAARLA